MRHKALSIYRIEHFAGGKMRTAIVVSSNATQARKVAALEAIARKHHRPSVWEKKGDYSTICLRIGVTTPLGGCYRSGEVLRLDEVN